MLSVEIAGIYIPLIETIIGLLLLFAILYRLFTEKKPPISAIHPASLIATGLGVGKIKFAPGTFGTLFALFAAVEIFLSYYLYSDQVESPNYLLWLFPLITIILYSAGVWASNVYMKRTGKSDPGEIVIDEIAGIFTAISLFGLSYIILINIDYSFFPLLNYHWAYLIACFALFRFYDIRKPGIIGTLDKRIKGGHGVMLDDIMAGIFTAFTMILIIVIMFYSGLFKLIISYHHPDWLGTEEEKIQSEELWRDKESGD